MPRQITEMLKGTLEGIVLAILATRSAYGYEITSWLRENGFTEIAEGTVYALLVRFEQRGLVEVEKVPSEKGPPRKVFTLNDAGRAYLAEFWANWSRRSPLTADTPSSVGRLRREPACTDSTLLRSTLAFREGSPSCART